MRAQSGDLGARDELVVVLLPVVKAIACGMDVTPTVRQDLIQEGSIALLDAIARYDPARGVRLSVFAGALARGAMRNALRSPKMRRLEPLGAVQAERAEIGHVIDTMIAGQDGERLTRAMKRLTAVERRVVRMRFGL